VAHFFVRQGDYASALDDLREAARIGWVEHSSFYGLAWTLATCPDASLRNGREAVETATKACEATKWKDSYCLDAKAVAQAESGNISEAISYERQALALLSADPVMQPKMEARLALFQKNKPYHESAPGRMK
jgi:tetratricopeptide (TPR) repeat protein